MSSRRRLLVAGCATAAWLAGCLSGPPGATDQTDTPTETGTPDSTASPTPTCTATPPPEPTDAAADPRSYPDRPAELTATTVESFVAAYERAYRYNDALAASPDKIGRTNEFEVHVRSVSVETDDGGYTATVSGQQVSEFIDRESTTTPETRTETPLPAGHGPFEATYVVTEHRLRRGGVVRECW